MGIGRRRVIAGMIGALASPVIAPFTALAEVSKTGNPRLLQGPMLGPPKPGGVTVWSRASGPFRITVEYSEYADLREARRSGTVRALPEEDYTTVVHIDGLKAGQRYYYRMLVEDDEPKYLRKLAPFPAFAAPDRPLPFRIAFGSCVRSVEDPVQPIWEHVAYARPDLFFWLGDNIYGDSLNAGILAEEYRRQRIVPNSQDLQRRVPNLAIWDDHDYGLNDGDRRNPIKKESLGVFKRYWPNPGYGTDVAPGVFFKYDYAGVDFFFLDGRYYRDPNDIADGPDKTMLGNAQLSWLMDELKASDAPFKVLLSGGGWTKAKGPGGDSWASFLYERNLLFDFIRDEAVSGVVLMSGDTHVAELNAIPWSQHGGYDLYDIVSSNLNQDASDNWAFQRPELRIREVYAGGPNFGLIEFDAGARRPNLTAHIVNIFGEYMWKPLTLYADELVNGVESWKVKMDESGRQWHKAINDVSVLRQLS